MSEIAFDSNKTQDILMSANAFHTLKNNLVNNIGSHKTKGFLFRFGKEFGMESAKIPFKIKVPKILSVKDIRA